MSTVASKMIKDESKTLDDVGLLNEQRIKRMEISQSETPYLNPNVFTSSSALKMKETLPRNVAMFGAVF